MYSVCVYRLGLSYHDYGKIISRFYSMAKTYILLAHGTHIDESLGDRNIHSVVQPGQKLLTRLYTPTGCYVLPLLSDICRGFTESPEYNPLYTPLYTNVKVSACKDTKFYAGLYECIDGIPTHKISFLPCQSFTLIDLYDWLLRKHNIVIKLIFVGCIGPIASDGNIKQCIQNGHCIDRRYDSFVNNLKSDSKYIGLQDVNKINYEAILKSKFPPLDLEDSDKFPKSFKHEENEESKFSRGDCQKECVADCVIEEVATQPFVVSQESIGGSRRKSKRKKKSKLSKHSRKKKHTRRLNRRV